MTQSKQKIVAFLCNWCSYAGADLAGEQHKTVPANVRVVRVMCTGRIDPQFVLKAFKEGANGVAVLGCHPGDCHYKEGNYAALKRMKMIEKVLAGMGIEPWRFKMDWVSAHEADKFSAVLTELAETIKTKEAQNG